MTKFLTGDRVRFKGHAATVMFVDDEDADYMYHVAWYNSGYNVLEDDWAQERQLELIGTLNQATDKTKEIFYRVQILPFAPVGTLGTTGWRDWAVRSTEMEALETANRKLQDKSVKQVRIERVSWKQVPETLVVLTRQ